MDEKNIQPDRKAGMVEGSNSGRQKNTAAAKVLASFKRRQAERRGDGPVSVDRREARAIAESVSEFLAAAPSAFSAGPSLGILNRARQVPEEDGGR